MIDETLKKTLDEVLDKFENLEESENCEDCYYNPQCRKCENCYNHCRCK